MKLALFVLLACSVALAQDKPQVDLRTRTLELAKALRTLVEKHACKATDAPDSSCVLEMRDDYQRTLSQKILLVLDEYRAKGIDADFRGHVKAPGDLEAVYNGLLRFANLAPK